MTLSLVLNAMSDDASDQAQHLISFINDNSLDDSLAKVFIFYEPDKELLAKETSHVFSSGDVTLVYMPFYDTGEVVGFLKEELKGCDLILLPDNIFGTEISSRLALRLGALSMNRILSLCMGEGYAQITKNIYSGYLCAKYLLRGERFVFTVDKALKTSKPKALSKAESPLHTSHKKLQIPHQKNGF